MRFLATALILIYFLLLWEAGQYYGVLYLYTQFSSVVLVQLDLFELPYYTISSSVYTFGSKHRFWLIRDVSGAVDLSMAVMG